MNNIKFRIAAKTDVGLVRENNEDNFQASADLSTEPMRWMNNEICSLGNKGALLVVADGMGGMNAGEVASEIAINTVRECFSPSNITDETTKTRYTIEKFMNSVIVEADRRIKAEAKAHPESRGMGTTIVIGWLFDKKLYVSWCGDSRAYIYNPKAGLHQISKDHSYVQSLVDKGAISKEDAFDYPESNIITRCLSDSSTKAKPESLIQPYDVCDGDIILLCTDGLSGMIHDYEIEEIIRKNEHDMDVCTDELIHAACKAEGADNITICLCQILQGAGVCDPKVFDKFDNRIAGPLVNSSDSTDNENTDSNGNNKWGKLLLGALAFLLILAAGLGYTYTKKIFPFEKELIQNDTINDSTNKPVGQQTIVATDGSYFTLERAEGDPQRGDRAYPNGTYLLNDNITVVIKDSVVASVNFGENTTNNEVNQNEPAATGESKKDKNTKANNSPKKNANGSGNASTIFGGLSGGDAKSGSESQEDELTPINTDSQDSKEKEDESIHVVEEGETLDKISKQYNISIDSIKAMNPFIKKDKIKAGERLRVK